MTTKQQVYRFCPSPTGTLHIGSARSALFNYLLARANGGKFILRIEDTDLARSTQENEANIIESLRWLGIEWDEFHRQSERFDIYKSYADTLVRNGKAYIEDKAIKFSVPKKLSVFTDLIRGEIEFDGKLNNDIVLIKSDGSPGFHFCNVVDDYTMGITHVIRGEDHISNTPKQLALYDALGWNPPEYGHISLILATDRSKLSKRNGAKSVDQFESEGYLPKAVFNYLALLGWSHKDGTEILTKQELINCYDISRVSKSNSVFDPIKLEWYNKQYMQRLSNESLSKFVPHFDPILAELIKPKLTTLNDIVKWTEFLNVPTYMINSPSWFPEFVAVVKNGLSQHSTFKTIVEDYIGISDFEKGEVYSAIRYALTSEDSGLPLFSLFDYLGSEISVNRMEAWIRHSSIVA